MLEGGCCQQILEMFEHVFTGILVELSSLNSLVCIEGCLSAVGLVLGGSLSDSSLWDSRCAVLGVPRGARPGRRLSIE